MANCCILKQGFKQCFFVLFLFQICLRLILVSGKTHEFLFSPSDTAYYITQHVYENWPEGLLLVLFNIMMVVVNTNVYL